MADLAAEEHVEVAVPAHELWALRWDFSRLPEYNSDVREVRLTRSVGRGEAGARWEFLLATPQGAHPVVLEVTESIPDREVAAVMQGGMTANERFVVEPRGENACTATLSLWLDLPDGLSPSQRQATLEGGRREIRKELDAMRSVLEAEAAGKRAAPRIG